MRRARARGVGRMFAYLRALAYIHPLYKWNRLGLPVGEQYFAVMSRSGRLYVLILRGVVARREVYNSPYEDFGCSSDQEVSDTAGPTMGAHVPCHCDGHVASKHSTVRISSLFESSAFMIFRRPMTWGSRLSLCRVMKVSMAKFFHTRA